MSEFYKKGLHFTCVQCGYCCREEPGYVFLSKTDLTALAAHFSLSTDDFSLKYCRIVNLGNFKMISLREKPNNDCIFFENNRCLAYQARPLQCRSYPFWAAVLEDEESWLLEAESCPGIGKGKLHRVEEIEEWLSLRREEQPLQL